MAQFTGSLNQGSSTIENMYGNGVGQTYGSPDLAQTAFKNLMAGNQVKNANPNPTPTLNNSTFSSTTSQPTNQYSVVTSQPANDKLNGIQNTYDTTIKPAVTNGVTTNATNTQNSNAVGNVPPGYSTSLTKTGAQGEYQGTNAQGQPVYISPKVTSPTSSDITSILSGNTNGAPSQQTGAQTPVQTAQTQTGINPSAENTNYQEGVGAINDAVTSASTQFQSVIQSLSSGSIPFTPAQQSLIDATNSAFKAMTDNANLKAAALSSETGGVSNITNAMGGQLIGIATEQAAAIAKMEVGFQQQNYTEKYQTVTAAYDAFQKAEQQKMDTLTKIHDSVMTTYQQAVQAAQAQQTFNQTVYHDTQSLKQSNTEFRDAHDQFGNVVGTDIYDKTTGAKLGSSGYTVDANGSNIANAVPTVQLSQDGTPDQASQQAFLQTIPQPFRQLVSNVANYKQNPSTLAPKTKTQIEAWAAQYDPTYDSKQYASRQALLTNFTSGKYSQNINALNTAVGHITDLSTNFAKLGNAGFTPYNTAKNFAERNFGAGGIVSAETNMGASFGELATTFKSSGATDTEVKNMGTIDSSSSPEQAKAFIETSVQLLASRLNALEGTYMSGMGKPPTTSFLKPTVISQLSTLKNQGYTVNIPGVYYTDKSAWQSNGGTQDQWNGAVDTLTKSGIPLTEENILQTAQVMNE